MEKNAQKTMSLEEVRKFYHNAGVVETSEGFEVSDPRAELVYVLPKDFYIFVNGEPIDPKMMLTLPRRYSLEVMFGCEFKSDPIYLKYTCGRYEVRDGGRRFYPADFAAKPNDPSIEAVLVQAHWDLREGAADVAWCPTIKDITGTELLYDHCDEYDDYGSAGDWYWILKLDRYKVFSFACLFAGLFSKTMNPVIDLAKDEWQKFEKQKGKYRDKILEIVKPLNGVDGWSVNDSDSDQTVIRRRDASGQLHVRKFRHDSIGWTKCAEMFNWTPKPETTKEVD